jgi:hypothetical protein
MPWNPGFKLECALKHWDRLICIFLAGELAESLDAGCPAPKSVGKYDRKDIRFIGQNIMGLSALATEEWAARLRPLTGEMLALPAVWDAVAAVAERLLAQAVLTRGEVYLLMEKAGSTRPGVKKYRSKSLPQIHRLAPRLAGLTN